MQLTAYAKINWSLAILGTRPDGYHLLDTIMQTVAFGDTLTFSPADALTLTVSGTAPTASPEDNLILCAARLLRQAAGSEQGAAIHLEKRIPTGAGLGGGSADAAATLLGLSRLWQLDMQPEALAALALQLGADVPFCLTGGLARATGIGEMLTPLPSGMPMDLVIIKPEAGLSTPDVYRAYDAMPQKPANPDLDAVQHALAAGKAGALAAAMGNALQPPAISLLPEVAACINALHAAGALRAQVTGSGSAVIGLFADASAAAGAAMACRGRWKTCLQTCTFQAFK